MKVLFISQWYPHRYDIMAGLFVRKHAQAVAKYADVATLYIFADPHIRKQEIIKTKENGFLEIYVYFPSKNGFFFSKTIKPFQYFNAYRIGYRTLIMEWGRPDIVQANIFTRTAIIALLLKLVYGIPYTVIEHWTRYFREETFRNFIHKWLSAIASKYASAVLPVTLHLQKCMQENGLQNSNYQIINNVVDDIFFDNISRNNSKKIRILNVTCFDDAQKNLTGILKVISRLKIVRQDFELVLVGDGIDFNKIRSLCSKLQLNDFVSFTGLITGNELVKAYQEAHFSVLFSNYENIPVVISESLSCGRPVISTNVGGIAEHINKDNGLLIAANNQDELYDAILFMLDHYKNFNEVAIIQSAKEKYSYQNVGKKLVSIYKTILSK